MTKDTENKSVLIVEDEPFLRELCTKKLTMLNYNVEIAIAGKEAIKKINSIKPGLVLLDLIIPGLDGFKVIEKIRSHPDKSISQIPIVVLSNLGQQEDIDKAVNFGANDYLIKSNFTITEIVDKVRGYL